MLDFGAGDWGAAAWAARGMPECTLSFTCHTNVRSHGYQSCQRQHALARSAAEQPVCLCPACKFGAQEWVEHT